jgi:hypothetical protein
MPFLSLSLSQVRQLMSQLDHNGDGFVSYDEWLALTLDWTAAQRSSSWEEWVQQVRQHTPLQPDIPYQLCTSDMRSIKRACSCGGSPQLALHVLHTAVKLQFFSHVTSRDSANAA